MLVKAGWIGYRIGLCVVALTLVSGCASWFDPNRWGNNDPDAQRRAADPYGVDPRWSDPTDYSSYRDRPDGGKPTSLMETLFAPDKGNNSGGGSAIGVNSFLWHASLDTISFMPLASADPFGGTIITDWYSPRGTPNERFKVNIFILNRELRADGVRVTVFRQTRDGSGQWVDAPVDPKTGRDLENSILTRARQMRLSTASNQ